MNKKNKSLISILVAASLTGCFGSKTTDELISEAKVNTEQENYEAAVVLLKNALRNESESAIARYNLGLVYFNLGQMELAEKEFNLAAKYGYDNALVTSYLIKVFNAQDKDAEVIDIYEASNGLEQGVTGEIAFYSALAFRRTNEIANFNEAIGILKQIGKNTVYADLSDALINIAEGNYEVAIINLKSAKTKDNKIILLDLLLGEVYAAINQSEAAITAYKAYLAKAPYNKKVQLMIANLLIKGEDYKGAEIYLDELIQVFPKHSIVNQLKAIVRFEGKDYEAAIEFGEVALQAEPSAVTTKLITGLSAYYLKRFELAHQYLNAIRNELPKIHPAKKVLAIVQNQLGYKEAAIDTMSSFESFSGQDIELLSEIGKSVVNAKDIKNITGLIDKISRTSEKSAADLINMGRLKLSVNDVDGLIDIEKALKLAPEMSLAKEALIQAYIVQYEFTKALTLSEELQQSQPDNHKGYKFSAKAMLGLGNVKGAIKDAQRAVELKNNDTSSVVLLANLHLLNENKIKAKEVLLKQLEVQATDIEALMFYYKIEKELGNEAVAIKYIQDTANKFGEDINVSLLLGTVYYMEKDFANVIKTLSEVDESKANSDTYWFALGSSYFYTQQFQEAKSIFSTWHKLKPNSKLAALKLATTLEALKEFVAAKEIVDSELENARDDVQLQMLQAYYAIRLGKYDDANYLVKKLERKHPDSIQVEGLKGQLYYGLKKYTESLPLLNKLYSIDPNQQNISILASAYAKAGLANKAVEVLNHHQQKQNNIVIESLIAQYLMAVDYNKAKPKYAELVKKQPNNVLLLNNYAWTLFQLKEYELAKSIIEKAVSLMPMQPKLLDTLGVILLAKGETQQAISTFQKAVELAPKDSEIALHLDEALRK